DGDLAGVLLARAHRRHLPGGRGGRLHQPGALLVPALDLRGAADQPPDRRRPALRPAPRRPARPGADPGHPRRPLGAHAPVWRGLRLPAAPPRRPARPGRTGGRRAAGKRELGAAARGRRGAAHGLRALSRHHAARSTAPPPAVATPAVDATTGRGHGGTRAMRRTRTATPPPPP